MKYLALVILLALPVISNAQTKKKVSYAKGTLYANWGYHRSGYTKSNLHFAGAGYDFTLKGATAYDQAPKFSGDTYFNPKNIAQPQVSARVGYYFQDHWGLSLGYDHMKYIYADNNAVSLSGTIDPTLNAEWSGSYTGESVVTHKEVFNYGSSDGLNYIRFELTRTDMLAKFGKKDWFAVSSNAGLSVGGLLSFTDFTFAGQANRRTVSLSGYGISLHAGLRLEFFKHLYLQSGLSGGIHHQVNVLSRPNDPSANVRQSYGFVMWDNSIGILLYVRPTNGCDSCPVW